MGTYHLFYRLDPLGDLKPAGLSPRRPIAVESGDGASGTSCQWHVWSITKTAEPSRLLASDRAVSGAARPDTRDLFGSARIWRLKLKPLQATTVVGHVIAPDHAGRPESRPCPPLSAPNSSLTSLLCPGGGRWPTLRWLARCCAHCHATPRWLPGGEAGSAGLWGAWAMLSS